MLDNLLCPCIQFCFRQFKECLIYSEIYFNKGFKFLLICEQNCKPDQAR